MYTPSKSSNGLRTYEPIKFNDNYSIYNTVLGTPNNKVGIKAFDSSVKIKMKTLKGVATNGIIRY